MILGIDTSGAQCAVALVDGALVDGALVDGARPEAPVVRRACAMQRGHAEHLMPMIDAVLAEAGASFGDLTRIGVCTGPGSFTGIRIGVAAARGLALGLGVPAIGIGRLEALAAGAAAGRPAVAVVPGPQGAAYAQDFDAEGRPEGPPRLVAGDAPMPGGRVLIGAGGLLPEALADAAVVARLAAGRAADTPPAPLYLRDSGAAPPREAPPPILDA